MSAVHRWHRTREPTGLPTSLESHSLCKCCVVILANGKLATENQKGIKTSRIFSIPPQLCDLRVIPQSKLLCPKHTIRRRPAKHTPKDGRPQPAVKPWGRSRAGRRLVRPRPCSRGNILSMPTPTRRSTPTTSTTRKHSYSLKAPRPRDELVLARAGTEAQKSQAGCSSEHAGR